MNYKKIYDNLIAKRKIEKLFKEQSYYCETHHIIPRCIGGSDEQDNLINLYAREHFIAHLLLCKIYFNEKGLIFALWRMCNGANIQRKKYKISSKIYEKIKIKLVNEQSKKWLRNSNPKFGGNKGKNNPMYQHVYTEEELKEISKRTLAQKKIKCEYCNIVVSPWMHTRWHGDNCLKKEGNEKRLPKNHNRYTEVSINLRNVIINLYLNNFLGPKKIGEKLGYSATLIIRVLKENNIKLRNNSEAKKLFL
jgi:hypothetical protein